MKTPEAWHTEFHKRCPNLMSVNFLNPRPLTSETIETFARDIQREAYRAGLADALHASVTVFDPVIELIAKHDDAVIKEDTGEENG